MEVWGFSSGGPHIVIEVGPIPEQALQFRKERGGIVVHAPNRSPQEEKDVKIVLSYTVRSRPIRATQGVMPPSPLPTPKRREWVDTF